MTKNERLNWIDQARLLLEHEFIRENRRDKPWATSLTTPHLFWEKGRSVRKTSTVECPYCVVEKVK